MSYPPAQPPEGFNPYAEEPLPEPPSDLIPLPPGYPFTPPMGRVEAFGVGNRSGEKNWFGVVALICGIVSILSWWTFLLPLPAGAAGLGMGIVSARYSAQGRATNKSVGLAGVVLGSFGILMGVLGVIIVAIAYQGL